MNIKPEITDTIGRYFKDKPVLKAYIFGSVARGEESVGSDIDILVDLDYSQKIGLIFIQMKLELETLLDQKVDLVTSNGLSPFLKKQIQREKQLIYERKAG